MSRVLQVRMVLVDEKTGEELGRKAARIHETDLEAGRFHLVMKGKEIFRDALFALKGEKWREFEKWPEREPEEATS